MSDDEIGLAPVHDEAAEEIAAILADEQATQELMKTMQRGLLPLYCTICSVLFAAFGDTSPLTSFLHQSSANARQPRRE